MSDRPTRGLAPHDLRPWQLMLLQPLGWLLRLWNASLRFEMDDASRSAFDYWHAPVALVMWHNRLFISPDIIRRCRRGRTFVGLISASRDGAWLAAFFKMLGFTAVRGSSSRGAREAVTDLIDVLRAGHDIGITPDGPRGPCYDFKPGGLIVTRRANVPLLLIGARFSAALQLRSWDGFYVPVPFSRVVIQCQRIEPSELPKDRNAALGDLTELLQRLNGNPAAARRTTGSKSQMSEVGG